LVAAFNIIGTIFMIVIEKTKDIGVLKAMGARPVSIRNIFMIEGVLIGAIGSIGGALLAWTLLLLQKEFKIISLSSDVYFMDAVPVEIRWTYFIPIIVAATSMCVLASWLPSVRASRLNPVDAIRYE
jgi:lipoprotein-releasing system permease protein